MGRNQVFTDSEQTVYTCDKDIKFVMIVNRITNLYQYGMQVVNPSTTGTKIQISSNNYPSTGQSIDFFCTVYPRSVTYHAEGSVYAFDENSRRIRIGMIIWF